MPLTGLGVEDAEVFPRRRSGVWDPLSEHRDHNRFPWKAVDIASERGDLGTVGEEHVVLSSTQGGIELVAIVRHGDAMAGELQGRPQSASRSERAVGVQQHGAGMQRDIAALITSSATDEQELVTASVRRPDTDGQSEQRKQKQ